MATSDKYLIGSQASLLTTELNGLANASLAIGAAYNNTQGSTGDGSLLCDLELYVPSTSAAPGANTGLTLWLLATQDGTNYEDGDSATTPARSPLCVFPLRAVATAQRVVQRLWLPWGIWKPLLKNDSTGVALASTGNTLKIRPVTTQGV